MTVIWVTGAAGFIGKHLVRHLSAKGLKVAGLDLIDIKQAEVGGQVVGWTADGLSDASLDSLVMETGSPEVIYHLAGGSSVGASLVSPYEDFSATISGTATLLNWLRLNAPDTRLVIVSSAAVYGDLYSGLISDESTTAPFSPYGAHKHAMEIMCRGWAKSFHLPIVAVRLFSVYGPGLTKQLLWDLCSKFSATRDVVSLGGTGNELRDWTHIDDVVRALSLAADFANTEMPVFNAGTGKAGSVRTMATTVASEFCRNADSFKFTGDGRPGDPFSLVAAPGLLAEAGFKWQVELNDGIADYVRWFKSRVPK